MWTFTLATGAPDVEHYDFLKDITRLERLTDADIADAGCALVLTNVDAFWTPRATEARLTAMTSSPASTSRTLRGELAWGPSAGAGTRRGREAPIMLRGTYTTRRRPYARLGPGRAEELRYLSVLVG